MKGRCRLPVARPALLVALLLVSPGSSAAVAAPGPQVAAPSSREREQLGRGDVVWRPGAVPHDGVPVPGARGAVALVRVGTPPDAVWSILTEPRRYPEIFPGLRRVELLEESPAGWLLRTEGKVGPFEFRYHTRYRVHPEAWLMTWRLDSTRDNDVFEDNWGWWRLVPEAGATLVVYAIGSVPASWQPLAGVFERWGITRALGALRDAALRQAGAGSGR